MKTLLLFVMSLLLLPNVFAGDFSVSLSPTTRSVCPSHHASYQLNVINNGEKENSFNIDVSDNVKNWTTIVPNNFSIGTGRSERVTVFIQPHYTAIPGNTEFTITTTSENNTVSLKAGLDIMNCRGVQLSSVPISACQSSVESSHVAIENTGTLNDTFILKSSQEWATLEQTTINLMPEEKANIAISLGGIPIGQNVVDITAESNISYAKTTLRIPIIIEKCFDVKTESTTPILCPGESGEIILNVTNTGTRRDSYSIEINSTIAGASQETIELNPNETGTVKVNVNLPKDARNDTSFMISIDGNSKKEYAQAVDAIPYDQCYSFITAIDKRDVSVMKSENTFATLLIKNKGKMPLAFDMSTDVNWTELSQNSITIDGNDSDRIFVYIAPTYDTNDGKHDVNVNLTSDDLSEVETIRVYVNQELPEHAKNETIDTMTGSNGPVINMNGFEEKAKDLFRFIFSPILNILGKL